MVKSLEERQSKPITNNVRSIHLGHPMKKKRMHTEAGKTKTSANIDFMLCELSDYFKDRESTLLFSYFCTFVFFCLQYDFRSLFY